MKQDPEITQSEFDQLLEWLSSDREDAARAYERIRSGLIRFFRFRGCGEAESLADETINRITRKLSKLVLNDGIQTSTYFYSFASKIVLEEKRRNRKITTLDSIDRTLFDMSPNSYDESREIQHTCLDSCMASLPAAERGLLISYYSKEKTAKIEVRKTLADDMNLTVAALHTKVHRMRLNMRECISKCLGNL